MHGRGHAYQVLERMGHVTYLVDMFDKKKRKKSVRREHVEDFQWTAPEVGSYAEEDVAQIAHVHVRGISLALFNCGTLSTMNISTWATTITAWRTPSICVALAETLHMLYTHTHSVTQTQSTGIAIGQ